MGGYSSVDPSMPLICGTPPWGLVSCAGSRDKQLGSMASTPAQELARLNDTNPPRGWTELREMTIRIDWSWAMLVHISSIHLSVSFRPVRATGQAHQTTLVSIWVLYFLRSVYHGPVIVILVISSHPVCIWGDKIPFHCVVFIACRNWGKSMLHISPSLSPFPFPINRVLCLLIVPKIYRPCL